mmetsp:Transcript_10725/g.31270  ORF Transcript_10725/g.31270 Transcript_10725/m.31270 type:complete len:543 (+) Transcript_10725:959-2587(+)
MYHGECTKRQLFARQCSVTRRLGRSDAEVSLLFRLLVAGDVASVQESVLVSALGQGDHQSIGHALDPTGIHVRMGQQDFPGPPGTVQCRVRVRSLHQVPKVEADLVTVLPPQKELGGQHLEVVVPHLVVGHHEGLVFECRVHPEPVVVHSGRRRKEEALVPPGVAQRPILVGEHVPGKVPVVHDQQGLLSEPVAKVPEDPVDLLVVDVPGGRRKVLLEVANVGAVDDHLVGASRALYLAVQEFVEALPFPVALLGGKVRPPLALAAALELGVGVALDVPVGDDRFVHGGHVSKGSIRQGDGFEVVPLEAAVLEHSGGSVDRAGRTDRPSLAAGQCDGAHSRRGFRDGVVGSDFVQQLLEHRALLRTIIIIIIIIFVVVVVVGCSSIGGRLGRAAVLVLLFEPRRNGGDRVLGRDRNVLRQAGQNVLHHCSASSVFCPDRAADQRQVLPLGQVHAIGVFRVFVAPLVGLVGGRPLAQPPPALECVCDLPVLPAVGVQQAGVEAELGLALLDALGLRQDFFRPRIFLVLRQDLDNGAVGRLVQG